MSVGRAQGQKWLEREAEPFIHLQVRSQLLTGTQATRPVGTGPQAPGHSGMLLPSLGFSDSTVKRWNLGDPVSYVDVWVLPPPDCFSVEGGQRPRTLLSA